MTSDPTRPSTSIDLRVRYAETDQMGVVYHANYLVWCEVARTDLIRRFYLPYSELERRGVLLAVSEASLRYRAPARYEDLIRVYATVTSVRSRTVAFDYRIHRVHEDEDGDLLVTATTTLVALNTDNRPRTLPEDLLRALENAS